ncbi:hypothetical protein DW789_08465, partial [Phocaeicola plebeius]
MTCEHQSEVFHANWEPGWESYSLVRILHLGFHDIQPELESGDAQKVPKVYRHNILFCDNYWYYMELVIKGLLERILLVYIGGKHSIFRHDNFIGCFSAD